MPDYRAIVIGSGAGGLSSAVRFNENHPDDWTLHMVCPNKREGRGDFPEPMDPPPRTKDDVWIFRLEDGFRLHLQGNCSGKGWNNILQLPCLRRCSK
jgi:cation diffusion facilitator CzcD-associated flavoprotein CzcO